MHKPHPPGCLCDECQLGIEAARRHNKRLMKKYGWVWHYVREGAATPTGFCAHTHGFPKKWGHPDFEIVCPLPMHVAQAIFNQLAHLIGCEKKRFGPGPRHPGVIANGYFVELMESHDAAEGGRDVLRIILPDALGRTSPLEIDHPFALQWQPTLGG
jgi:hypothetical protein